MKHSSLLMSVLGSSLVLGGAMFTAPHVAHSAGALYLAGQVKLALGDTNGGLQLMSRAARERQDAQEADAPKPKPVATQIAKACSGRSAIQPKPAANDAVQNAKLATPKPEGRPATFAAAGSQPKLMMASMKFPGLPFEGREFPGFTREQVQKMNEAIRSGERGWIESQRLEQRHQVEAQKLAAKSLAQQHRVKVIVHDLPGAYDFTYEFPQATPQP